MGDAHTARVVGKGKIMLKLTSSKTLALNDTLHVPEMPRNLISGSLLNKAGSIKLVFDSDKLVLSHNGDFVGKGYCNGGLFALNVISDFANKASTSSAYIVEPSAYIVEPVDLWHTRLGHVNYASVKRMRQLSLIPDFKNSNTSKCEM